MNIGTIDRELVAIPYMRLLSPRLMGDIPWLSGLGLHHGRYPNMEPHLSRLVNTQPPLYQNKLFGLSPLPRPPKNNSAQTRGFEAML